MNKKRFIIDSFWEDEQLLDIDKDTKYLLLYLITNPSVNLAGLYKISKRKIEFHTSLTIEEVSRCLKTLEKMGKVYYLDEWIFIKKFIQHNNIKNSNIIEGIRNALEDVPKEILEKAKKLGLSESLSLIDEGSVLNSDRSVSDSDSPPLGNSNSNSNSKIYTDILSLWNSKKITIHKQLSDKAKKAINSLLKEFSVEEIKNAINVYSDVLKSEDTFWTYKWTLEEFLKRSGGARVFAYKTLEDYKKSKINSKDENQEPEYI